MKKICLCLLGIGVLISCQKDDLTAETDKGYISVNIGLFITVNEVEDNLKSTKGTEDFLVIIYDSSDKEVMKYNKASEIPSEIPIVKGEYYIVAHSNNNLPAAFNNPYYFGRSLNFEIQGGEKQEITVNCELANTIIAIVYSTQIKNNYSDYSATVSTSAGSLVFAKDETRAGYFQPLPLSIQVTLSWLKSDGSFGTKTLSGNIPELLPRKKYEIHIDAGLLEGSAALSIIKEETQVPVEIIELNESGAVPEGLFGVGDLLITEIMYNPVQMEDIHGEWFEIYNNTGATVDLYQLVIKKNESRHIVNNSILLNTHEYIVLARTDTAADCNKYVYGSGISLNNSGAVGLSLYNYGTDGTNGSLISSVEYGTEDFPDPSGASICLSPSLLNYTDAMRGDSWCVSLSTYNTGDFGTPGKVNDSCE